MSHAIFFVAQREAEFIRKSKDHVEVKNSMFQNVKQNIKERFITINKILS